MKCKKLFALLLSLCMIASSFVAVSVAAETEYVIDINLPLDDASELTWVQPGVTVSNANEIGGRDAVVKAEGVANSNNNTVGVKLPDGFAFCEGDVLTYSLDVYSETAINPDLWLRNHGAGANLNPMAVFYGQPMATGEWITLTKTVTYDELEAIIPTVNSNGTFATAGDYAFYLRPRSDATIYLDNLTLTVEREVIEEPERGNVIDMEINGASDVTWCQPGVTVSDANGIGGRDNVVKLAGLANSNNNTAGVKLPDGFAFCEGDVLSYSFDVYAENAINPDMWMRNHDSSLNPFATFYEQSIAANTWVTVAQTFTFEQMNAKIPDNSVGTFDLEGNYAFYLRPRGNGTVYIDNFKVTVSRVGYETPEEVIRGNVVDINVDGAEDMTWTGSEAVVLSNVDGIGGRDNVVKAEGVADSNNNTVGVTLGENFAFCEGDILTFSVDVYSETAINPDFWLRNHTNLPTFTVFYNSPMATNKWNTITKTVTYADLVATGVEGWEDEGTYALYLRPRSSATVYFDNFKVTVSREGYEEPDLPVEPEEPTPTPEAPVEPTPTPDAPADPTPTPDANRGNVIDINAGSASGLTFIGANVSLTDNVSIGGKDGVVKAENVSNSNTGFVGVKLPDGFAFEADDIITYSVDVYSETANFKPDIYIRDHSDFNPMAVYYGQPTAANEWITVTKTVTVDELDAVVSTVNSSGTFVSAGNYGIYVRPRDCSTLYVDNFKVTVSRVGYVEPELPPVDPDEPTPTPPPVDEGEKTTIYEKNAPLDEAKELTWVATEAVVVTEADGIGGRDKVLKAEGLDNSNNNTVGISLPEGFAFQAGDIVTISVDVYSETVVKPDLWVRNHDSSLNPFVAFYHEGIAANTWTTVSKTTTFEEMMTLVAGSNSTGTFATAGKYAIYVRPRSAATLYLDNLVVKVEGYERSEIVGLSSYEVIEKTVDSVTINATFSGNIVAKAIYDACSIKGKEDDSNIVINVVRNDDDKKNAVITISGLASSTKYDLVLDGIVLPTATISFETLDEATVVANLEDGKIKYSITNNTDETKEIYTVLLRCKGNTVIESIIVSPEEGGCASEGTVSGEKEVTALNAGEYFRVFAWTVDNGNVNSMAPFVVIE